MATDPAKIVERIKAHGANVYLDGAKLKVANRDKLPAGAMAHIKEHARAIADWLDDEGGFEERAAIMQYDGGLTRAVAEYIATLHLAHPPAGTDEGTWSWLIGQASEIVDRRLGRAA